MLFRSREGVFAFDPTKITITAKGLGLTGAELEDILVDDYNIQMELSDFYNVLGLITLGDTNESIDKLIAAFKDISKRFYKNNKTLTREFLKMPHTHEHTQIQMFTRALQN